MLASRICLVQAKLPEPAVYSARESLQPLVLNERLTAASAD